MRIDPEREILLIFSLLIKGFDPISLKMIRLDTCLLNT